MTLHQIEFLDKPKSTIYLEIKLNFIEINMFATKMTASVKTLSYRGKEDKDTYHRLGENS